MKRLKQAFYRFAYRIASRLSDITGGARLFVRWKVALAAVIIGLTATSIGCRPWASCYEPAAPPTCYDPAPTCYITPEEPCPETGEGENAAAQFPGEEPGEAVEEPVGSAQ